MKILTRNIVTLIIGMLLICCRQNETNGIIIASDLFENQTYSKNRELTDLIEKTLNKDEKALSKLNDFWCGGGAGCYDLGFVVTQIIYRLGEKEFIEMVIKLDRKEKLGLEGLIMAGLEYGDNDKDGKMDDKTIENEFPSLKQTLRNNK